MNQPAIGQNTFGLHSSHSSLPERNTQTSYFLSDYQSVHTRGTFAKIQQPIESMDREGRVCVSRRKAFFQQLQQQLQDAYLAGVEHPIAIGAVPFDMTQPVNLTIPLETQFCPKNALVDKVLSQQWVSQENTCSELSISSKQAVPNRQRFEQGVKQAIANFGLSDIQKAVLSRTLTLTADNKVDPHALFARLLQQNSRGYQFSLPIDNGAILMGASPELLVRKQGASIYSNPLAGSAKRSASDEENQRLCAALMDSPKDRWEHQFVTEALKEQLSPLCSTLDIPEHPSLLSTPTMWHLSSEIHGTLRSPTMNALELASMLHPTPAVCGYPQRQAKRLIQLIEGYERGYFAGMVGWCDGFGHGEWAVTIRCGAIHEQTIQLFAGAGIVDTSDPASEWLETEAKLNTMLNVLGLNTVPESANIKHPQAEESC